ncbi:hypothetical protein Baya_15552 [Bagarius yarrelli]|uniref:Uncharacterized protein n=1 Tax=Bagarius yarrelli TaxID=175774 RepID=A0A556VC39_BAGYA|nr:hypothetical protein Baya_15552 [Bagarius yarrelli]
MTATAERNGPGREEQLRPRGTVLARGGYGGKGYGPRGTATAERNGGYGREEGRLRPERNSPGGEEQSWRREEQSWRREGWSWGRGKGPGGEERLRPRGTATTERNGPGREEQLRPRGTATAERNGPGGEEQSWRNSPGGEETATTERKLKERNSQMYMDVLFLPLFLMGKTAAGRSDCENNDGEMRGV